MSSARCHLVAPGWSCRGEQSLVDTLSSWLLMNGGFSNAEPRYFSSILFEGRVELCPDDFQINFIAGLPRPKRWNFCGWGIQQ